MHIFTVRHIILTTKTRSTGKLRKAYISNTRKKYASLSNASCSPTVNKIATIPVTKSHMSLSLLLMTIYRQLIQIVLNTFPTLHWSSNTSCFASSDKNKTLNYSLIHGSLFFSLSLFLVWGGTRSLRMHAWGASGGSPYHITTCCLPISTILNRLKSTWFQ